MRDSADQKTRPATTTNILGGPTTVAAGQRLGNVVRQAPTTTTGYTTGGVRTSNVVTTGVRGSNVYTTRPSTTQYGGYQTSTLVQPAGQVVNNGQWTSTVYAPETYQVGTYDQHVDSNLGYGRRKRNSYVIEVKEGQTTFLEERYVGERIVNITETRGEDRIISSQRPEMQTYVKEIEIWEDEPIVQERFVDKHIEVLEEKRVRVEKYVDVEYDVIVERQIDKVIEKEIEIEKIMERQI